MPSTEQKPYGVVQDDGTVTEYPTQAKAERAGRLEALVVRSGDEWVYPTTGRTFHPSDVQGLSPSQASEDAEAALRTVPGSGRGRGLIVSRCLSSNPALMITEMNVLKSEHWQRLAPRMVAALRTLPGVVEVELDGEEPMYNYFFLKVVRKRMALVKG